MHNKSKYLSVEQSHAQSHATITWHDHELLPQPTTRGWWRLNRDSGAEDLFFTHAIKDSQDVAVITVLTCSHWQLTNNNLAAEVTNIIQFSFLLLHLQWRHIQWIISWQQLNDYLKITQTTLVGITKSILPKGLCKTMQRCLINEPVISCVIWLPPPPVKQFWAESFQTLARGLQKGWQRGSGTRLDI